MDQERLKWIQSALERYGLTLRERLFVEAVKTYFKENGKITDQQASVLEGIYREREWIRKILLTQNNLSKRRSPKAA